MESMATETIIMYGYKAGDRINVNENSSGAYLQVVGVWSNNKTLRFFIPLSKPILASTISISGSCIIHYDKADGTNGYETITMGTGNTVACSKSPVGVAVQISWDADHRQGFMNLSVQLQTLQITFS